MVNLVSNNTSRRFIYDVFHEIVAVDLFHHHPLNGSSSGIERNQIILDNLDDGFNV